MSKKLQNIASSILTDESYGSLSFSTIVQICLLSDKRYIIQCSKREMFEVSQVYSLLFNHNVLFYIKPQKKTVKGFNTPIYLLNERSLNLGADPSLVCNLLLYESGLDSVLLPNNTSTLLIDSSIMFDKLCSFLFDCGFERVDKILNHNEYCVKGGIVEFFSINSLDPIRVSFLDYKPVVTFFNLSQGVNYPSKLKSYTLRAGGDGYQKVSISKLKAFFSLTDLCINNNNKSGPYEILYQDLTNYNNKKHLYSNKILTSIVVYKESVIIPELYLHPVDNNTQIQLNNINHFMSGDLVCHINYGIGRYVGLTSLSSASGEVMNLQYQDGSLYVPISDINKVSYVSRETGEGQNITYLSKQKLWLKKRRLVEKGVLEYIESIVNGFTVRTSIKRPPWIKDELESDFIDRFEYEDTKDQVVVWKEIKRDLESNCPMNRLLCGDVGFGKTEIAMRVAFRIVINGGKVIVVVPTSTLLMQHEITFKERFNVVGIKVSCLNSKSPESSRKAVLNSWLAGDIEILIGTHSVLNSRLFLDLASLFIIDEEHRFGVEQKNKIFDKYVNKDFLCLSATPIPRSLHLSFLGISQISTMTTPPLLRKPIQTIITNNNDELIKYCIMNEVSSGGQCFYVHNNINELKIIERRLLRLIPEIVVKQFHSQLKPKVNKGVFTDFINNKIQVLLATTIVASGVNVKNVGTIIINNAHMFGLSELHQLRGRVGRGYRQSFAYLLLPKDVKLTPQGYRRLKTIETNNFLGSGYKIAKSDLSIRGPGALFGYKQSGYGLGSGYELYSKLLSKQISKKYNINNFYSRVDKFVYKVSFSCYIPPKYVLDEVDRLNYYNLIESEYKITKVFSLISSLKMQYGNLPIEIENLLFMRCVVLECARIGVSSINCNNSAFSLSCPPSCIKFNENLSNAPLIAGVTFLSFNVDEQGCCLSLSFSGIDCNANFLYLLIKNLKKVCFYE